MMRFFSTLLLLACLSGAETFNPKFYAFRNGVAYSNYEEEARQLKSIGYAGISQCFIPGDPLAQRVTEFKKQGVHVLSVYLNVNDTALTAEAIKPLAHSGALVELTVQKESPETVAAVRETVELAETLGVKVVLYPHAGFSVATIPEALALIEKVAHPNLGVMFNLCHFLHGEKEADLERTLDSIGDRLFAVSTSGASIDAGKGWDQLIKRLDKGSFPQKRLFSHLKKIRFSGPVTLQCYGVKGDKEENLKASYNAWEGILEDL